MNKYLIDVNRDICVGDGLCREVAPATFDIGPDGKSRVLFPEWDEPQYVKAAARSCRLNAITLFDAETGEQLWPR